MEEDWKKSGLEQKVMDLMEAQSKYGVDSLNMLLMLSLLNLMNIVEVLQKSIGEEGQQAALKDQEQEQPDLMQMIQQATTGNLNPAQLLSMLGNKGGQMPNPAALMSMISQFMPQQKPQKPHKLPKQQEPEIENKNDFSNGPIKWDQRLG